MPSKALLRPAQALAEARRVPGAAQAVTGELDVAAILARRDEIISDRDDSGQLSWLHSRGVTLIGGGDPPVPGLAALEPWTNRQITTAASAPDRLIVLGGGVVGVEMADAFVSLGSRGRAGCPSGPTFIPA